MNTLPPPERLAALVSDVTETMFGLSFIPDPTGGPWSTLVWRTAVLPIPGERPLTVGLSSDQAGCATLGAAMFSCPPSALDSEMINDALCELLNMTAGLLKTQLALNQNLGLPRIVSGSNAPYMMPAPERHRMVLRAKNLGLVLWVVEGLAA